MNASAIATAFQRACLAELDALKPGNVHRFSAGHGMQTDHFQRAAEAAAPWIAASGTGVGTRIETAVRASLKATGLNTNLGILLLCAPLAVAAQRAPAGDLRGSLRDVLENLGPDDAEAVFRAIAAASPGGLGQEGEHDVRSPARIGLLEAMELASGRDSIARQYVTGFADIFDLGLPRLAGLIQAGPEARTEAVYLAFMAAFPDSHIARKFGKETAEQVRREAVSLATRFDPTAPDEQRRPMLAAFDASLKAHGLNPGTSADLTVATLFVARLQSPPKGAKVL